MGCVRRVRARGGQLVLHAVVARAHRDRLHVHAVAQVAQARLGCAVCCVVVLAVGGPGAVRWFAWAAGRLDQATDGRCIDMVSAIRDVNNAGGPVELHLENMRRYTQREFDRFRTPEAM